MHSLRAFFWIGVPLCLLANFALGCGQETSPVLSTRSHVETPRPPRLQPSPWLTVDPYAAASAARGTIYHQGPLPPRLLHTEPLPELAGPAARGGQAVVAEVVLSPEGRVARARLLRAPAVSGLPAALVAALRGWRFEPARLAGRPVAVYYTVTVPTQARR